MSSIPPKTGILSRLRARCNSWVMLDEDKGFVLLPRERILFTSPARTTLALQTPNTYPGKEPLSIHSPGGIAYLTNQRLVYLPTTPTPALQSLSAPILSLQDTHISAPFFGPNIWHGILLPVPGGGIPPQHPYVEVKMTFKDGGAFDFHSNFERVKETLSHAVEIARESGHLSGAGANGGVGSVVVDLEAVHLEQLPAYEEATSTTTGVVGASATPAPGPVPMSSSSSGHVRRPPPTRTTAEMAAGEGAMRRPGTVRGPAAQTRLPGGLSGAHGRMPEVAGAQTRSWPPAPEPDEPPPGYEEAQQSASVRN